MPSSRNLKKAGFPPLAWYDAPARIVGARRPARCARVELEKQMLIPQYSTSRLIDRLVDEGLAARREMQDRQARPSSSRSPRPGVNCRRKCGTPIPRRSKKHVGSKLSDPDAIKLCGLLDRLGCSCNEVKAAAARDGRARRDDTPAPPIVFADIAVRNASLPHGAFRSNRPHIRIFYGA